MKPRYWSRIAIFAYPTCIRHERDRRTPHEGTDRAYPSAKSVGKPINRKSILTRNFSFGSKVKEIGLARGNAIYVTRTLARWRFIFFYFFGVDFLTPWPCKGYPSITLLSASCYRAQQFFYGTCSKKEVGAPLIMFAGPAN